MKNVPRISESEWAVASAVWERDGQTAAEIAARLDPKWKPKTVNTFLSRLVTKGVLSVARDGRAFRYHARLSREQCIKEAGRSFLQRVFGGAVAPMLAHFCETSDLSDEDVAHLKRILSRKTRREEK